MLFGQSVCTLNRFNLFSITIHSESLFIQTSLVVSLCVSIRRLMNLLERVLSMTTISGGAKLIEGIASFSMSWILGPSNTQL